MNGTIPNIPPVQVAGTGLLAKLANVFVSPGEVFEEVANSPHRMVNWLVPLALVCLTSLLLLVAVTGKEQIANAVQQWLDTGVVPADQVERVSDSWRRISALNICAVAVAGGFWSALVLWVIGRFLLGIPFAFSKALEVVGLAGTVFALGTVVTIALVAASGDPGARPALSLAGRSLPSGSPLLVLMDTINVFHVWTVSVLAIGLSRLARVTVKEACFWVFGYWFMTRLALVVLA
jgi:hypothetical protein